MIFHQFLNDDLGCACYLVGDEEAGIAVVVDPPFAIDPILAEAAHRRVRIVRTIETHTHADHVSGHGRLALEHGVPVSIYAGAEVDYPHDPMHDGDEIEVGAVTLGVIHTPGHRPEHCCLTVIDRSRAGEPWLVLTGDSLFVGDVARPDLAVGASRRRRRALPLAPQAARAVGRGRGVPRARRRLALRQVDELEALDHDRVRAPLQSDLAGDGDPGVHRELGRRQRSEATEPRAHRRGQPRRVLGSAAGSRGSSPHPRPTSSCSTPGRSTHTSAATGRERSTFPSRDRASRRRRDSCSTQRRPVCVLAETADEARRAIAGLHSVAFFDVPGYVLGGGDERTTAVTVDELEAVIAAGAEVFDVREKDDRDTGYIPGSRNIPYRLLATCCPDLPADRPGGDDLRERLPGGDRGQHPAARGYDARPVVHGGMVEWRARGGDTVEFRRCGSP